MKSLKKEDGRRKERQKEKKEKKRDSSKIKAIANRRR
jgi:hypothetical protein